MCFLIFSTNFAWTVSHSKKNSAAYDKWYGSCKESTRYSCQIFLFSQQILEIYSVTKFNENTELYTPTNALLYTIKY